MNYLQLKMEEKFLGFKWQQIIWQYLLLIRNCCIGNETIIQDKQCRCVWETFIFRSNRGFTKKLYTNKNEGKIIFQ